MNLPPPPQSDDPIITQFRPVEGQWELTEDNINRIDPETGRTILQNYCHHINTTPLEVYRYLIEVKGCDVNAQNIYNDTPLHDALRYYDPNDGGDITVLMYLFTQKGVDGNIKGQYGYSLLHMACTHINTLPLEIFRYLIETKGCDVNVQNNDNDTPLHYAINSFNPTGTGVGTSVLMYLLSQENVDVNMKGWNGETILHMVCKKINNLPLDVFKLLIETHGADVNVQDKSNNTSVCLAFREFKPRNGDINVLTYLINQNNVNINIMNEKGRNLLHYACINNLPRYRRSLEIDAEYDTVFCQIVEMIAERCVQEVFEEKTPLEATTTM